MKPYLVYQAEPKISCLFYTIAIRSKALQEKHEKGLKGFLARGHRWRSNRHLAVCCYLDKHETVETEQDLIGNGLRKGHDYTIFEADNYASSSNAYPRDKPLSHDVGLDIPWLKAEYTDWGIDVWYTNAP